MPERWNAPAVQVSATEEISMLWSVFLGNADCASSGSNPLGGASGCLIGACCRLRGEMLTQRAGEFGNGAEALGGRGMEFGAFAG